MDRIVITVGHIDHQWWDVGWYGGGRKADHSLTDTGFRTREEARECARTARRKLARKYPAARITIEEL